MTLIHFELTLLYVREGSNVSFLYVEIQFSQHYLLKRLFFPPLKGVGVLAENKLIIYVRIFLS